MHSHPFLTHDAQGLQKRLSNKSAALDKLVTEPVPIAPDLISPDKKVSSKEAQSGDSGRYLQLTQA